MDDTLPQSHEKTQSLVIFGGVLFILALSSVVPAKWFGVQPLTTARPKLDITALAGTEADANKDNAISWGEFVNATLPGAEFELAAEQPDPKTIARLNDPNNLTASFAKNLYITSSQLAANPLGDAEKEQQVINQLIGEEAVKVAEKVYKYSDLIVAKSETKASIKAYGNAVAVILDGIVTKKTIEEEMKTLTAYVETEDPSTLLPLVERANDLNRRLKKLETLEVPQSASLYHALLLNRVSEFTTIVHAISLVDEDPVRTTVSIDKYPDSMLSVLKIYIELAKYFELTNIAFTQKEAGHVFMVGYTF